jgi:hypothetical protein
MECSQCECKEAIVLEIVGYMSDPYLDLGQLEDSLCVEALKEMGSREKGLKALFGYTVKFKFSALVTVFSV